MPSAMSEQDAGRWEAMLRSCTLCPHQCRANRHKGGTGVCRTGRYARIASAHPHFGEEKELTGEFGSGTIFFSNCNLYCIFCQNWEISHEGEGIEVSDDQLAKIMLRLQKMGCHNINLVTPTHVLVQVRLAWGKAKSLGLHIPLVYNSGGYDSVASLELAEEMVDIYMPDFKFWDPDFAKRMTGRADYPEITRRAVREMYRQKGDLQTDSRGIAVKGLLIRHLVMPGRIHDTREILHFIAHEISVNTYVNIMDQYYPCGNVLAIPDLSRRVTNSEYRDALNIAEHLGLTRGLISR